MTYHLDAATIRGALADLQRVVQLTEQLPVASRLAEARALVRRVSAHLQSAGPAGAATNTTLDHDAR